MRDFCFKNRNGKERPGFPCFKAFWSLGRWRQVCVTGREDSCIHCTLVWGELPSAGICHRQPLYRIPVRRGWGGAFRKRHIKHGLCTSGHKSPWKHMCARCSMFYCSWEKRRNYKLDLRHKFLGSRWGIMIQFDKGFLIPEWVSKPVVKPSMSLEVEPGS